MRTPELPDAVVFDVDGTLVDTEPFWLIAERELVQSSGATWNPLSPRRAPHCRCPVNRD